MFLILLNVFGGDVCITPQKDIVYRMFVVTTHTQ